GADYLVWVQDAQTATLLHWSGSAWAVVQTLTEPLYRLDFNSAPMRTDIALPFDLLGLTPAASLKVVAVATEENALQLWAAFPDKNPLDSPKITSAAGQGRSFGNFALTQA